MRNNDVKTRRAFNIVTLTEVVSSAGIAYKMLITIFGEHVQNQFRKGSFVAFLEDLPSLYGYFRYLESKELRSPMNRRNCFRCTKK